MSIAERTGHAPDQETKDSTQNQEQAAPAGRGSHVRGAEPRSQATTAWLVCGA